MIFLTSDRLTSASTKAPPMPPDPPAITMFIKCYPPNAAPGSRCSSFFLPSAALPVCRWEHSATVRHSIDR
jgi:hypothetical protein